MMQERGGAGLSPEQGQLDGRRGAVCWAHAGSQCECSLSMASVFRDRKPGQQLREDGRGWRPEDTRC